MRNTITLFSFLLFFPFIVTAQQVKPGVVIGHSDKVVALGFSPTERFIVSAGNDGMIKLWEMKTGRLVKDWDPAPNKSGFSKYASDAIFLDEQYILGATNGKPLQRWEFASNEADNVAVFTDKKLTDQPVVRAFRLHPKKKEVLTLDDRNRLVIWSTKTLNPSTEMDATTEEISSFCFSQDGQKVYAGTKNGNVITWDANKGKRLSSEKMQDEPVLSLEVSAGPGSKIALSGGEKTLDVWSIDNKNDRTPLANAYSPGTGSVYPIRTAQFSPDGKYMAYGAVLQNYMAVVWDVVKKETLHQLIDPQKKEKNGQVNALCFSLDHQKLLTGYADGTILLWEVDSARVVKRFEGRPRQIKQLGFSEDRESVFIVHDLEKDITLWNGKTGDEKILKAHDRDVLTASFSPRGNFMLSSGEDGLFIKWDYHKDSILWQTTPLKDAITQIAISPDEKYALTSSGKQTMDVWDLQKMAIYRHFDDHKSKVTSLAFSADGKFAMSASNDNTINVYDLDNNFKRVNIPGQKPRINPAAFSPDSKYAVSISCNHGLIELWDLQSKQLAQSFRPWEFPELAGHSFVCGPTGKPAFSPDNRYFLVPSLHGAFLWSIETGQPQFLKGDTKDVRSVAFTAGGKVAVAGGNDGSMTLWRVADGRPMVTVYQLDNNNWVAITPDGLFDASPGALDKMYFVKDLETIDLSQLKDLYYEPGLLAILMGHKIGRLRDVGGLDDLKLYPEISAEINNKNQLEISLTERKGGGGIGKVSVFINGAEVIEDACHGSKNCPNIDLEQFTKYYFSKEDELPNNVITVFSYNQEGWLKSPPYEVYPFPKAGKGGIGGSGLKNISFAPRPDPGIYAIVIGTSNYKGGHMSLDFPDKDAEAIATSIKNIGNPFFKGTVNVSLLTTDPTKEESWPTKKNIQAAFKEVAAKATAEDVFFLFLSGHGVTYSEGNDADFYYLTMDCGDMNLSSSNQRVNFCISTDTLTDWIKKIPAQKRVVILDACHSGKAAENLFAGKSLSASQERELERLKDRTGMFVLASSESGQKSWEDKNLQQGLLTYSLLYGMAKTGGNGIVDVLGLFNFARDYVPSLAKGIKEDQTPVLTVPTKEASSFPIGLVNDPSQIPIAKKNDFIAPSLFLDKDNMDDHLFLSNLFDEHLAEDKVEGKLSKMVLSTSPKIKDVYAIRGLYEVTGESVILDGKVFRGGVEKATFKVVAQTNDSPAIWAKKIEDAVNGVL